MSKYIILFISLVTPYSFGTSFLNTIIKKDPLTTLSLKASITKSLFLFKDNQQKETLNQSIKNKNILAESLRFDGLIIKNLDLSGMCLRDIDFSNCTFINVKFNDSDLTGAQFNNTTFKNVDLVGAILDCPLDDSGNPIMEQAFKIINGDHYELIKQYSDLMNKSKIDQAKALNKFFAPLYLDLRNKDLKNFNLKHINLNNINLIGAELQETTFSEKVKVPDYPEDNCTQLFNQWCTGDSEHQEIYQNLVNTGFNLFRGVGHTTLIEGIKSKKDLRNANLTDSNLQGANFTGANLQKANLTDSNLQGADFTGANLQKANLVRSQLQGANFIDANLQKATLSNSHLQGAIFSENITISDYPENNRTEMFNLWCSGDLEHQEIYQKLVNTGFDIMQGVDHEILIDGIKIKKDFKNCWLRHINLEGADFTGANLKKADLVESNLQGADFTGANLQKATLSNSHFQGADFTGANLQNTNLSNSHLQGTNFTGANLQKANLLSAYLQGAIFSKNITISDYPENNRTEMFNLWCSGDLEHQEIYQKLVNTGFDIMQGVDHEILIDGIKIKKDFKNCWLRHINLEGADFTGANLKKADLAGSNLIKADFTRANLKRARIVGAKLRGANLSYTNLQNTRFYHTDLREVNFIEANLKNMVLDECTVDDPLLSTQQLSK